MEADASLKICKPGVAEDAGSISKANMRPQERDKCAWMMLQSGVDRLDSQRTKTSKRAITILKTNGFGLAGSVVSTAMFSATVIAVLLVSIGHSFVLI